MKLLLSAFHIWKPFTGINFIKVRWQRNPNKDWRNGFGMMVLNFCIALYWGKRK